MLSNKLYEIFLNKSWIFIPVLAETSIYEYECFKLYYSIYFFDIYLYSTSDLFPTRNIRPSWPFVYLTKSIHLFKPSNVDLALKSKVTRQTSASLTYDGINDLNLYCPAVSQSCSLMVYPSTCNVFVTKSIPTVG